MSSILFAPDHIDSAKNKLVIVTGSNSGIGKEIAKSFVDYGAKVIIACRNEQSALQAKEYIGANSEYIYLDLSDIDTIYQFVDKVQSRYGKVDILINNAGVLRPPLTRTKSGLELTFAVNYIGYYSLSILMIPLMNSVAESRIINMSSISQYNVKNFDWDNINSDNGYNKNKIYALTNLFRIMLTVELNNRLKSKDYETISLACHPGVSITNIVRNFPKFISNPVVVKLLNKFLFQSPDKASKSALVAALNPSVNGGDFIGFDTRKQYKGSPKVVSPNQLVFDEKLRQKLWDISVEITGIELD
jgi:NAD(P)-dependent dehydrogenase (short-subunit alcohol dehydrogenase family)